MTDTDYSEMTDKELVQEHDEALAAQNMEHDAGNMTAARDVAEVRMEMWEEAESRGIESELVP